MREAARWVLAIVFIVGLLFFLSMQYEVRGGTDPDPNGIRMTSLSTVGYPWIWFERRTETVVRNGEEITTGSTNIRIDSPAWLILVGIVAAGYGMYRLRPRKTEGAS